MVINGVWECGCLVGWPETALQGDWEIMTLPVPCTPLLASLPQTKLKGQHSKEVHTFLLQNVRKVRSSGEMGLGDALLSSLPGWASQALGPAEILV